jgi:hypothetical protein
MPDSPAAAADDVVAAGALVADVAAAGVMAGADEGGGVVGAGDELQAAIRAAAGATRIAYLTRDIV